MFSSPLIRHNSKKAQRRGIIVDAETEHVSHASIAREKKSKGELLDLDFSSKENA